MPSTIDPTDRRVFYKMTGSGNDFVFVDGRHHSPADWPAERIREICDRRAGVGADGLVLLTPLAADEGAVRMVYLNSDGSRAGMCGNAALCAARLAERWGIVPAGGLALETDAGRLQCRIVGPDWLAELRFPVAPIPDPIELDRAPGERRAFHGTVGVPHTIVLVDDVDRVAVVERGRALRFAPRFAPAGTNVNFVAAISSDRAAFAIRTYERGVEDETLACGTGTIAAGLALAGAGLTRLPGGFRSRSGAVYSVRAVLDGGQARDVWLQGEGRLVFTGLLPA